MSDFKEKNQQPIEQKVEEKLNANVQAAQNKEQEKKLNDRQHAEAFAGQQQQKNQPVQENAEARKARLQQQLADTRALVAKNIPDEKSRHKHERKIVNLKKTIANEKLWYEMKQDFPGQESYVDRKRTSMKISLREELLMGIMGDDKLMQNPRISELMEKVMVLANTLGQTITDFTETDAISAAYESLIDDLKRYDTDASAKKSKLPAKDQIKELLTLLTEESQRFSHDVETFRSAGIIPEKITNGMDILERKHINGQLDGTGRESLLNHKIKILSLERDGGEEDSDQMKEVKQAFKDLALAMQTKIEPDQEDFDAQKAFVQAIYDDLIKKCKTYLKKHKNPHSDDGKERKEAVQWLMNAATSGKVSVPIAAKSYVQWGIEGATWADAYGISGHAFVPHIVESKKAGIDLNEVARQQELEKELEKEFEKERERQAAKEQDEKKKERERFKKRYKPNKNARAYFLLTGVWKEDAEKGEDIDQKDADKNWYIRGFDEPIMKYLTSLEEVITDEEFITEAKKLNAIMKANYEWFEDPANMAEMKEKFMLRTWEMLDVKEKAKEKESKKKGKVYESGKHQGYDYTRLINLDYPEIDALIKEFFKENLTLGNAISEGGAKMQLMSEFVPGSKRFKETFAPFKKLASQKKKVDKALDLSGRGSDIYKSEAIKYLIMKMDENDPEYKKNMEALKTQANGNDALISMIIEKKFSPLTRRSVYRKLRTFLGDKALFWNYRKLRDLIESYMRTMAVTDRDTMRVEKDFDIAYASTVKSPFAARFKDAAAKYLTNLNHGDGEYTLIDQSKRRDEMKRQLKNVNTLIGSLEEAVKGKNLTADAWDRLMTTYEKFIGDNLHKFGDLDKDAAAREKQNRENYLKALNDNFTDNKGTEDDIIDYCKEQFDPLVKESLSKWEEKARAKKRKMELKFRLDAYDSSVKFYKIKDKKKIAARKREIEEELDRDLDGRLAEEIQADAFHMAVKDLSSKKKDPILNSNREAAMKKYVGDLLGSTYKDYEPLKTETPEQFKNNIKKRAENSIKKYMKEAKPGDELLSLDEYLTGVSDQKARKILPDDFSFKNIFINHGLINNDAMKKAVPDEELRRFLADNVSTIIIGNPYLIEKYPFMRGVKGLDQMDTVLTYGQFDMVMNDILYNIAGEEQEEALKKVMDKKISDETRRYLLLAMAKTRTDAAGVDQLIKEEAERKEKVKAFEEQRLRLEIGGKYVPRDGKIRFRYDDLIDREKSWYKTLFGVGSTWLKDRMERFDKAGETWKALEGISPEAVDQVKQWMKYITDASEGSYDNAMELINALAKTLTSPTDEIPKNKGYYRTKSAKFKGRVFLVDEDIEAKYMKRTGETGSNNGAAKGDLLKEIKKAFGTILEGVDEKKTLDAIKAIDVKVKTDKFDAEEKKVAKINTFLLEMMMLNTQDVVFGHKGKGQKDFFTYNQTTNDTEYNKAILKWAKDAQAHDTLMEKQLSAYNDNPALKKELSDKLLPRFMNIDLEMNKEISEQVEKLNKNIDDLNKQIAETDADREQSEGMLKNYMKALAEDTDARKAMKTSRGKRVEAEPTKADLKTINNLQKAISDFSNTVDMLIHQRRKLEQTRQELNEQLYRNDSLERFDSLLKNEVHTDGTFSDRICDDVILYEERKKAFCEYGEGKLAPLWDAIQKNADIFIKIMDPAGSVANETIAALYERLAPLAEAITEVDGYVGTYFLEDNLADLLDTGSQAWKNHSENLKEKTTEEAQRKYWHSELNTFQDKYLNNAKKDTKTVNDVFKSGREYMKDALGKHLYYTSESVKKDKEHAKKKFRKWWFIDSKNYGTDKLIEENGEATYSMIAKNHAAAISSVVELYMHSDIDMMKYANSYEALKGFYKNEMIPRINENGDTAEQAFLNYILQKEYHKHPKKRGMFVGDMDELAADEIEEALAELSDEERIAIGNRLIEFRQDIMPQLVQNDRKFFRENANKIAAEYVENKKKALEEDESFTEEHRASYKARQKAMQEERTKIQIEKSKGRTQYDKKLFGGYLERLKEFGEKKQTLVYEANRSKLNKQIKSRGERKDDKLYQAALAKFVNDDGTAPYPAICAELFDEFCRISDGYLEQGDRFFEWMAGNSLYDNEIKRLKRIADCVKKTNMDPEWQDFLITYTAKFADPSTYGVQDEIYINKIIETAKHGIERIMELEAIPVTNPALKLAHRDACQKMRAWMFVEDEKSERNYQNFDEMIDAQKNYFAYAQAVYAVIDKAVAEDEYLKDYDSIYRARYENALHDYFTARIIEGSADFVNGKKTLDEEAIKKTVKERLLDGSRREALVVSKDSISSEDYENQNVYTGQMTQRDFEKALVMSKKDDLLEEYNNLSQSERKILIMSLYASQHTERGSGRVIYGQKDDEREETRNQIFAYISGEKVDFKVDYGRAIRAFQSRGKYTKLSADQELFKQALDYTKMIIKKKEQLRPRDWKRISGQSLSSMTIGDTFRVDIKKSFSGVKDNSDIARNMSLGDRRSFVDMLEKLQESDRKREEEQGKFSSLGRYYSQWREGSRVNEVMKRLEKLSESQFDMLIYILQDRSIVDFTTGGKDPVTGILAHANSEKRFKVFESLTNQEGRQQAIENSASPDAITYAMQTLLSFQVRDDKELTGGQLKESDFLESSLHRIQAIDWELLTHACDFVDEIERETNKKTVLAHATDELTDAKYEKGTFDEKRVSFYRSNLAGLESVKQEDSAEKFKENLLNAYYEDRSQLGVEGDDLMGAFMALEPQEKALFYRALENRDILDVSQKNLYKNIFGIAERDFVDVKSRDELTDEFLASWKNDNGGMIDVHRNSMANAFKSLCSIQINDDMDFEKMDGANWVDKNLHVNNQLLVFGRKTIIDWKLFKRALQFVIRAGNERKMAAGDEELYHALGDQSNGEMKFDRKYLRRNLHHTGARFMRFLAKEGYDQVSGSLGSLGTLAGISEFVVSKKTANFLHESANELYVKKDVPKEMDVNASVHLTDNKQGLFLGNLASLAQNLDTQKRIITELGGNAKQIVDGVMDKAGIQRIDKDAIAQGKLEEGKKQADKLDNVMQDLVDEREAKIDAQEEAAADMKVTGFKYVDLVLKYGKTAGASVDMLNKYLIDSPNMLEKADAYIDKYMGGFLSTKKMGEWYKTGKEWTKDKAQIVSDFFIEDRLPDKLEEMLRGTLGVLESSKGFLDAVNQYAGFAADVLGDFMEIVGSVSSIKKLNAANKEADEAKQADNEAVASIDFEKYDKDLVEFAKGNNASLMRVSSGLSKNAMGRKILSSIGSLAEKSAKFAKQFEAADFSKLIGAAFRTADFFWKCFADNKTVYQYYSQAGNPVLEKLVMGKNTLQNTNVGQKLMKDENHSYKDGAMEVGKQEFRLVRNGQGFETDEEIADYLKLNMVHSMLFSASKFNPLKESRILAECTLTILGLEDCIGKSDNDTAIKVYNKLKA